MGAKQLLGKTSTMWNHSALVEVLCCYLHSRMRFKDFPGPHASIPSMYFLVRRLKGQGQIRNSMKHLAPRPQTRSFDFNILEIVGSKWKSRYVCQASIGRETSSPPPINGLSECSVLPAAPDLKFTCHSIFQWLRIHGNAQCLKPGLLWHHDRSRVEWEQLLHKIKLSG